MAAPITITDWILVVVTAQEQGTVREITFSYKSLSGGPPSATDLNTLCQNWWAACGNQLKAVCHAGVTFYSVTATYKGASTGPQGLYVLPAGTIGTRAGAVQPSNVACCASNKTASLGRSFRGRTYLFGIPGNDAPGNILTNGYLTAAIALMSAMGLFTNSGFAPGVRSVVASRTKLLLTNITLEVIDNLVDSMRRRLTGRGR